MSKDNVLLRYIGKIKQRMAKAANGQEFPAFTIMMDNPYPTNKDGQPNKYHKGFLMWCDAETGKKFLVKQIELAGPGAAAQHGFVNSLKLDLSNTYQVDDLG